MNNQTEEERLLAEFLAGRVCQRAAGRHTDECVRNYPHDVYFIGNLRPRSDVKEAQSELLTKLAPVAFGAEFRVLPEKDAFEVGITLDWNCYYRIFPTFDQQREYQHDQKAEEGEAPPAQVESVTSLAQVEAALDDEDVSERRVSEAEERQQLADTDTPEVGQSAADRRRERVPQDKLFPRFRKIQCGASAQVLSPFRRARTVDGRRHGFAGGS